MQWHLSPFRCRRRPHVAAFYTECYVDDDDAGLDPPPWSLFIAGDLRIRDTSLATVLAHAVWDVQALVPQLARDFLCLHAGAVARDGRAVLLPAPAAHGKSSLVTALLLRGHAYLSDEAAAIDPVTGRVHAFPRHIKLDRDAMSRFPGLDERLHDRRFRIDLVDRFLRPEDIGAAVSDPVPVGAVVFPTAHWDGPARLEPITRSEAVRRLVETAFNLHRYQDRGAIVLARLAEGATAYVLDGGSPAERAEVVATL